MKAPGPMSDRANPAMDAWVVTPDRCGGRVPLLQRSGATDEDGRDTKQLPTLRRKELQGRITTQHFTDPASCFVSVCVCAHMSRILYQCPLV